MSNPFKSIVLKDWVMFIGLVIGLCAQSAVQTNSFKNEFLTLHEYDMSVEARMKKAEEALEARKEKVDALERVSSQRLTAIETDTRWVREGISEIKRQVSDLQLNVRKLGSE